MYQRIFVPVDDSETSNLALHEACHLAKEVGASLKLVHVVDLAQFGWGGTEFLDATELNCKSRSSRRESRCWGRPGPRPRSWA
ncbi:universal stress protein [Chromobacterium haemolyticum]|nr:universal stress protein [Chromobacterium haemolyticum]